MKERLIEFLAYLGIGQTKFEEIVGLSRGFVNNVGENITEKSLKKITENYPDLNINWLKTGEGRMLKNNNIGHIIYGDSGSIKGNIKVIENLEQAHLTITHLEQRIKDKDIIIELLQKQINILENGNRT